MQFQINSYYINKLVLYKLQEDGFVKIIFKDNDNNGTDNNLCLVLKPFYDIINPNTYIWIDISTYYGNNNIKIYYDNDNTDLHLAEEKFNKLYNQDMDYIEMNTSIQLELIRGQSNIT